MRTIQYDMILNGPYLISRNPDIHGYTGITSAEAIKLPGIRMIVEECKDSEKFFASFSYDRVGNAHPKFERQMLQVMRGELPEWELDYVEVGADRLYLSFMNRVLFDKYSSKLQAIKTWNASCPQFQRRFPPPMFFAERAFCDKISDGDGAKLRFEFDNPISGNTEVTIVSFFQTWENRVIELSGNKGRSFTFLRGSSFFTPSPVRVREWTI